MIEHKNAHKKKRRRRTTRKNLGWGELGGWGDGGDILHLEDSFRDVECLGQGKQREKEIRNRHLEKVH
jgi:hypothetical protein